MFTSPKLSAPFQIGRMFACRRHCDRGVINNGNSDAIHIPCTLAVERRAILHAACAVVLRLSTAFPQKFRVFESLGSGHWPLSSGIPRARRLVVMGKKGSQDSSTCDINTRMHVLRAEFITTYSVVDS